MRLKSWGNGTANPTLVHSYRTEKELLCLLYRLPAIRTEFTRYFNLAIGAHFILAHRGTALGTEFACYRAAAGSAKNRLGSRFTAVRTEFTVDDCSAAAGNSGSRSSSAGGRAASRLHIRCHLCAGCHCTAGYRHCTAGCHCPNGNRHSTADRPGPSGNTLRGILHGAAAEHPVSHI